VIQDGEPVAIVAVANAYRPSGIANATAYHAHHVTLQATFANRPSVFLIARPK
jgi:hypothetical protein